MRGPGPDSWKPYRPPADGAPPAEPGADEASLWTRWRDSGDADAHRALVELYMPYASSLAGRLYARRLRDGVEFDEYRQFAMVGLLESMERYVPDRGAQFKTFAATRIQGAILNGLEHLSEQRRLAATRRRLAAERTASLAPDPLPLERTEELLSELGEIGMGLALGFILEGVGIPGPQDGLPEDAYAQIEMRQVHQQVWKMVERLPERERGIIEMHYAQTRRFEEIARVLRLTKGRVSQLHRQAVLRLRVLISKADKCDVAY